MRYYNGRYDLLLREKENKKKKGKKKLKQLALKIFKLFILFSIAGFIIFFLSNKFINMKIFKIKNVKIKVLNEKIELDNKIFKDFIGENIFKVKSEKIGELLNKNYDDYKIKNIKKSLPSKLEVIVYRKVPLLLLDDNIVIFQDMEIGKSGKYSIANYVFCETETKNIKSVYDISGLPTIFKDIIRERNNIKKISFDYEGIKIHTKKNKVVVIAKGERIPKLEQFEELDYRIFDLRFKNGIYVKK